jgi:large subunit ribosomal protein L32
MGRPAAAARLTYDRNDQHDPTHEHHPKTNEETTAVAVPKRKMSRSNTRSRRANWKTTAAPLAPCSRCREPKLAHVACPTCGTYNGRDVLDV